MMMMMNSVGTPMMDPSQMMGGNVGAKGGPMGGGPMGSAGGFGMEGDMSAVGMIGTPRLHLNPMEQPFYQNLFCMLDQQGLGVVNGATAAHFLQKSGLARNLLHEIWRIADHTNAGQLNPENFAVACRLTAHAQNGNAVTPEMVIHEPPSLPMFDLNRVPEESMQDGVNAFGSVSGVLGTVMDPNMAAAAMMGSMTDGSGTPPMMSPSSAAGQQLAFRSTGSVPGTDWDSTGNGWGLTETDRQKYMNTFCATDSNADGFVEGMEAKQFFSMSGLQDTDLMQIWNLADQDGDGRLTLNEFAIASHMVSRRKRGFSIPTMLPEELATVLTTGLVNLQLPVSAAPSGESALNVTGTVAESTAGVVGKEQEDERKERKKRGRKKEKPESQDRKIRDSDEPSFGDLVRNETEKDHIKASRDSVGSSRVGASASKDSSQRRGIRGLQDSYKFSGVDPLGESPATLIESVIEADKQISRTLAHDVDIHDIDLRRLNEVSAALKQEIVHEKSELERQLERKRDFERQAEDVRHELERLKEERRKVDLERISMNRDISHYQDETLFLKQQVEDMQKDIQMLTESSQMLDKTYRQAEGQIKSLDIARRNVLESLKDERELLKKEEREIAELKSVLERMRREKDDAQSKQCVLQEKIRQADQDRTLLVSSLETERSKLANVRSQRIDLCEQKQDAFKEMTALLQQDWMQSRALPNNSQFLQLGPAKPMGMLVGSPASGWGSRGSYGQLKDAKGIPAGAPSVSSARSDIPYQSSVSPQVKDNSMFPRVSVGTPPHWTMFGSTPSGSGRIRGPLERRGVDEILGTDVGGIYSEPFNSNKPDYIGSRRTDKEFGSRHRSSENGGFRNSRALEDSDDHEGYDIKKRTARGRVHSTSDEDDDRDNSRSASRSTSRNKKPPSKMKDTELEVRFSDNLDLNAKSKHNASKRDRRNRSNKRSGATDDDVRSMGLETPSFGARSLNQSNSVTSH